MKYSFADKKLITVALFLWWSVISFITAGQTISQPIRVELEFDSYKDIVEVTPLPDSTLLLYRRPYFDSFKSKHVFQKLDQNLKHKWETTIELEGDQNFHQIYATPEYIYALYLDQVPGRFYMLKINKANAQHSLTKYNLKDFDIDRDTQIDKFKVLNNQAFILAHNVRNALVLHLDLGTNEIKTIPALYDQLSAYSDFHLDSLSERAEFVLAESNGIKGRLQVKRFSPQGSLYTSNFIIPAFKKNLLTAQLSPGDSASKILVGLFTTRNLSMAQGIFTTPLEASESTIKYYDFMQFKHFFDFLGKGARRRLHERAARYEAKNKELQQRYRLLFNDLKLHNDTLYLFAEAYNTVSNGSRRMIARATHLPIHGFYYPNADPNPAEIRFSHSIVCAFDKKGNLIWDNSYVLEDAVTNELAPVAQHAFAGDKIVMAYAYEKDIRYKIVDRDSTSDNELSVPLEGISPEDKLSTPEKAELQHWYGTHFITYGFQRVRPSQGEPREIYYLNKVSFSQDR